MIPYSLNCKVRIINKTHINCCGDVDWYSWKKGDIAYIGDYIVLSNSKKLVYLLKSSINMSKSESEYFNHEDLEIIDKRKRLKELSEEISKLRNEVNNE